MLDALQAGNNQTLEKRKAADVLPFLETYIGRKQALIDEVMQVVERYEKKRAMEDRAFQTMSPLRRMITGKKPDHHLAVEYIHYVRKPMEQVRKLRTEIEAVRTLMKDSQTSDIVEIPSYIRDEII